MPDTPWAIFMVCVSEWYLPARMHRSEVQGNRMQVNKEVSNDTAMASAALHSHHLLSLPFIMASREPMPRYFFTFTPFCSK